MSGASSGLAVQHNVWHRFFLWGTVSLALGNDFTLGPVLLYPLLPVTQVTQTESYLNESALSFQFNFLRNVRILGSGCKIYYWGGGELMSADDTGTTGAHSYDSFWCSTAEYLCSEYPCDVTLCIIVSRPCVFVYRKKCFPVGLHSVMCSNRLICKWILSNSAKRSGR